MSLRMSVETISIIESGLEHPFWKLWRDHVAQEWGPSGTRYLAELEKALNLLEDGAAASQARQIVSARKAIEQLMAWPEEKLGQLKRSDTPMPGSMSRRGGL